MRRLIAATIGSDLRAKTLYFSCQFCSVYVASQLGRAKTWGPPLVFRNIFALQSPSFLIDLTSEYTDYMSVKFRADWSIDVEIKAKKPTVRLIQLDSFVWVARAC